VLLEIGPGEGALTRHLIGSAGRLILVDIDRRVTEGLRELYQDDDVDVINDDFLEIDIAAMTHRTAALYGGKLRVVGNIPYNITSPILFQLLDNRMHLVDATLMMQREVARRIVSLPGRKEYGILSVFCQLYADCTLLFDVSASAFYPKPKVNSAVMRMAMLSEPRYPVADERVFRTVVRSVFGKRRKTLRNSLRYLVGDAVAGLEGDVDLGRRPEELTLRELVDLSGLLPTSVVLRS
jgi:16S rRNA (adenine1518-N6/adenine1519-N6)-dimethyltransferase